MIQCAKCDNDTRVAELVTAQGPVMLSGPQGSAAQPILAQVCTACGYIELYGPQPIVELTAQRETSAELIPIPAPAAVA